MSTKTDIREVTVYGYIKEGTLDNEYKDARVYWSLKPLFLNEDEFYCATETISIFNTINSMVIFKDTYSEMTYAYRIPMLQTCFEQLIKLAEVTPDRSIYELDRILNTLKLNIDWFQWEKYSIDYAIPRTGLV